MSYNKQFINLERSNLKGNIDFQPGFGTPVAVNINICSLCLWESCIGHYYL